MTERITSNDAPKPVPPPENPEKALVSKPASQVGAIETQGRLQHGLERIQNLPSQVRDHVHAIPGLIRSAPNEIKQGVLNKIADVRANPVGYGAEAALTAVVKLTGTGGMPPELGRQLRDAGPFVRADLEMKSAQAVVVARAVGHVAGGVVQDLRKRIDETGGTIP